MPRSLSAGSTKSTCGSNCSVAMRSMLFPTMIVQGNTREGTDPPHALWLLHPRCERARDGHAAEQGDELAPFQFIELHPIPTSRPPVAEYRTDQRIHQRFRNQAVALHIQVRLG